MPTALHFGAFSCSYSKWHQHMLCLSQEGGIRGAERMRGQPLPCDGMSGSHCQHVDVNVKKLTKV